MKQSAMWTFVFFLTGSAWAQSAGRKEIQPRAPWENRSSLDARIIARVAPDGAITINRQGVATGEFEQRIGSIFAPRPERTLYLVRPSSARDRELALIRRAATKHGVQLVLLSRDPYLPAPRPARDSAGGSSAHHGT